MTPETAGDAAWQRLADTRSFAFTLKYRTDAPFSIGAEFSGASSGDREMWVGLWRRGPEKEHVELRAAGDGQYERVGTGWVRSQRGLETRVLSQAQQVLAKGKLEYTGSEGGRYRYRFRPLLPLLDPAQVKSFSGLVEVEIASGLPLRVYCVDSTGRAEWEMRLGRFNRAGRIDIPFVPEVRISAVPAARASARAVGRATALIRARLQELGWDHRLVHGRSGVTLLLGQSPEYRHVEMLLSPGRVEVWWARIVTPGDSADRGKVLEVAGDAARRVELVSLIAGNRQIQARVRPGTPLEALLETSLRPPGDSGVAVLVVNGNVLSVAGNPGAGGLVFSDLGDEDDVRVICTLANHEQSPVAFTPKARE